MTTSGAPVVASTSPLLWYTSRATGTVALVLLTASVVLGILTASRLGSKSLPRFAVANFHRHVALLALSFLGLHVLTVTMDTFVPVGWPAAFVPFASGYSPLWTGLGAVASDLLVAVVITSLLRSSLPARLWRGVHWLTYASFPIAIAHAAGVGTDLRFSWMQLLTAGCILAVLAAIGWRLWASPHRGGLSTARPATARAVARRADHERTPVEWAAGDTSFERQAVSGQGRGSGHETASRGWDR